MPYKWAKVDPENPVALGRCDRSGFAVPVTELVKEMVIRGEALIWNGKWVWNRFADKPNRQALPDKAYEDTEGVAGEHGRVAGPS